MSGASGVPPIGAWDGLEVAATPWMPEDIAGAASSASQRSLADTEAPLGYATTRTLERVLSSCGLLNGAPLRFETADDVAKGGRPDPSAKTLTVELHRMGSALQDAAVERLCATLTETETTFSSTNLRLICRQVGST